LSIGDITSDLAVKLIGRKVAYYHRVSSTMEVARKEARRGAQEGTIVIAGEQTAGQGRVGRVWQSPADSIALSVILYPGVVYLPSLIMVASLAVVYSIEITTGLKAQIKWPNDVLINDRKVCGILVENRVRGNSVDCSIIGIGLNVNLSPSDLGEIALPATSLSLELGKDVSRLSIVRQLLVEMDRLYLELLSGKSVYEEWRDRLVTLGKRVTVTWGETKYEGVAESVAGDGTLLLRGADGVITSIAAGDISLRG